MCICDVCMYVLHVRVRKYLQNNSYGPAAVCPVFATPPATRGKWFNSQACFQLLKPLPPCFCPNPSFHEAFNHLQFCTCEGSHSSETSESFLEDFVGPSRWETTVCPPCIIVNRPVCHPSLPPTKWNFARKVFQKAETHLVDGELLKHVVNRKSIPVTQLL